MRTLVPASLVLLSLSCAAPRAGAPASPLETSAGSLRFIENDYPRALAEARERGLPLFVDAWVPW